MANVSGPEFPPPKLPTVYDRMLMDLLLPENTRTWKKQCEVVKKHLPHIYEQGWYTQGQGEGTTEVKRFNDYTWWAYREAPYIKGGVWKITTEPTGIVGITYFYRADIIPLQDALHKWKKMLDDELTKQPDVIWEFK
jgi:hypothetical protein